MTDQPGGSRLAGSDAGFLFVETATMTSSCLDLTILTPAEDGAPPVTLDELRAHVAARLPVLPSWRWRLAPVPGGIHHPMWVEDPDFDLDHHLRETTLPAPGGDAEFDDLFRTLLPQCLDLRHPLWQLLLVHGLAGDRQAIIFRFHHTIADGAALITTIDRLFGPAPEGAADPAPWHPAPVRRRRLLADALREQARNWRAAPAATKEILARFKAVEARRAEAEVDVPLSMNGAPWTVLNRASSAERTFARTTLPLADLQAVRKAAGVPLSDVLLTVVAGALRAYLGRRDQLPDGPLVVNVPVANDPPGAPPRQHGNRFANFFAYLATDEADPRARLTAVAAATAEAKVQLEVLGRSTLPDWLDRIPPVAARPLALRMNRAHLRTHRADFNVLVSNVRTDGSAWRLGGHAVEHLWMSGPPADAAGLNITITGFGDDAHIAIVAVSTALDRPDELAEDLRAALDELRAAVGVA